MVVSQSPKLFVGVRVASFLYILVRIVLVVGFLELVTYLEKIKYANFGQTSELILAGLQVVTKGDLCYCNSQLVTHCNPIGPQ